MTVSRATHEIIVHAGPLLSRYDVLFSDVWVWCTTGRSPFLARTRL